MNLNGLRKGLFGYKKESVYQYISSVNEEFSQKLIEKDDKNDKYLTELRERIASLELELAVVKKENETFKKMQYAVSNSVIEAQSFAIEMKNETKRIEDNMRNQAKEKYDNENRKLDEFSVAIERLRTHVKETLNMIDSDLQDKQSCINDISQSYDCSDLIDGNEENDLEKRRKANMSLFRVNHNVN